MTLTRIVQAETLDHLEPHDPAARRSRRDLVRVHRVMGTRSVVANAWRALVSAERAARPLRVLELGAGDGSLLLGLARSQVPRWTQVHLSLMDRQDIVTPTTLAAFAEVGWSAQVQVADVLVWAAADADAALGEYSEPLPRWDLITTSLFLHHFEDRELDLLLAATAARCDRFFACEPRRSWWSLAGSHLVGALGANAVTRQDAVLSVRAGFRDQELNTRWAQTGGAWQTRESSAGLFSHTFSARRSATAP